MRMSIISCKGLNSFFRAYKGHPTQFMKIMHYSIFVMSPSVKKYLIEKGVDPDTVYLNDFKFM